MPQIFNVLANDNAHYKRNELESGVWNDTLCIGATEQTAAKCVLQNCNSQSSRC